MQLGVVFPQTELGADPAAVRAFAQAAEKLGYAHLVAFDHVLGVDTSTRPDWRGPYTMRDTFHEPFVLFGYLAGITTTLELVTAIIILPQRQTALVAKQAAEVDVLSGGRLRLGVGIGWNDVEYEALGEDFHNRGHRSEEQVEVLRALWAHDTVTFEGKWHTIPGAGINPRPARGSIPVWFGGGRDERVLRRIARLGDGWFPQGAPDAAMEERLAQFRGFVAEAGRDAADVGIEARAGMRDGLDESLDQARRWEALGATHLAVNTMGAGYETVEAHIDAIALFKQRLTG
ncbi:MAG: LLM class F420-dependent oxidoreductase [Chloroflexi bacterium]|nr:LLM class F420-dependent oxidoreductase [Chloroflexota bacterium]